MPVQSLQALLAEFLGTSFLTMVAALVGSASLPGENQGYIAVGITLTLLIYVLDHISGAHFNPAVTMGCILTKKISLSMGLAYIVVQSLGGMAGSLMALAMAGREHVGDVPHVGTTAQIYGAESIYAFALVLVMLNVATEKNAREPNAYFGLAIGFTVLAGASAVGGISGGFFNPAVATGLEIARAATSRGTQTLWIYWVAGATGAVVGSGVKTWMNSEIHSQAAGLGGLPSVVPAVEFTGTFFLTLTAGLNSDPLAVGAILLAAVYQGDHVCGVDFNPAVTLGAALRWAVPASEFWKVGVTTAAQFVGGILGGITAYGLSGQVGYPNPTDPHGLLGAAFFEGVWTTLLVLAVCCVMTPISADPKDVRQLERRGIVIGFTIAAGVYAARYAGNLSGGVFNPALGLGIAVADAAFQNQGIHFVWIYFVAPFIGSLLGAGLFSLLHSHRDPDPADFDLLDDAMQGLGINRSMPDEYGNASYGGDGYSGGGSGMGMAGDSYGLMNSRAGMSFDGK